MVTYKVTALFGYTFDMDTKFINEGQGDLLNDDDILNAMINALENNPTNSKITMFTIQANNTMDFEVIHV